MRLTPDQKAGLYVTAIVHLVVIILLLAVRIGFEVQRENSFVLDFTKQEELEKEEEQTRLQESAAAALERLIAASAGVPIRNVTVDRSALKDDRGTNAEELYREAERLAKDLRDGQNRPEDIEDAVIAAPPSSVKTEQPANKPYSGPSVLSWSLDGRNASHLPIPAYRCLGAGQVTVIITVDPAGKVLNAKVQDDVSSPDGCLRNFAVRAARLSRFSAAPGAAPKQIGNIVYEFIAQ